MRYFTYISDAKVDMLLPQIPSSKKRKRSAELGFNVGLLSGKLVENGEFDNRVIRLLAVEQYIRDTEASDPASWLSAQDVLAHSIYLDAGAVLWVSGDASNRVVLAGSAQHLVGGARPESARTPYSSLVGIMNLVRETVPETVWPSFDGMEHWPDEGSVRADLRWLADLAKYVRNCCRAPQRITFLARQLISGRVGPANVTAASPLYVELAP